MRSSKLLSSTLSHLTSPIAHYLTMNINFLRLSYIPAVVMQAFNPSREEAVAGRSVYIPGQPRLHSEILHKKEGRKEGRKIFTYVIIHPSINIWGPSISSTAL